MTDRLSYADVVIANGASVSTNEVDTRSHDIVGIEMPAAWTAAGISFLSCFRNDGSGQATSLTETFEPVFDGAGAEVTITAVQGNYVGLTQAQQFALRASGRVKIRSGTSAVPVPQGAARTLRLILSQLGE